MWRKENCTICECGKICGIAGQATDYDKICGIAGQATDYDKICGIAGQATDYDKIRITKDRVHTQNM